MESGRLLLEDLYHFSALMRMGEAVKEGPSMASASRSLVQILVEELPLHQASLLLEVQDGILKVVESARRHDEEEPIPDEFMKGMEFCIKDDEGESFIKKAVKSPRPYVEALEWNALEDTKDIKVGIPLDVGGKMGLLCLKRSMGRQPEARDFSLWELLGHQTSLILNLVRLLDEERNWGHLLEQRVRERTRKLEKMNEQLVKTRENLMRSERLNALGQMAAGIAHNFNNILATILGHTQLYRNKTKDHSLKRCLDIIEKAAWDGAKIVERIQSFAGGNINTHLKGPVSINNIIKDVKRLTAPRWRDQARKEGKRIRFALELKDVPYIEGNEAELREMLTNIIMNSIDAMPRGGEIKVKTAFHDGNVDVTVSDTGVGISSENLGRVFDPFYTTKGPMHCGLGLSTVYGIVEGHGGRVSLESAPSQGTTVRICLPVPQEQDRPGSRAVDPPQAQAVEKGTGRMLLVEDDDAIRETLLMCLEEVGEVEAVGEIKEAMRKLKRKKFDLLVVDLSLADGSGLDLIERAREKDPSIAILVVTGWGKGIPEDKCREMGILRIFIKPFPLKDLQRAASDAIKQKRCHCQDGIRGSNADR
jgi:signal transduction histidine kinase/ActR/RegA family two-component response regulator